jgi:hypothetical protein
MRAGRVAAGEVDIERSVRDGYEFMIVTPDVTSMIERTKFYSMETASLSNEEMSAGSFAENSAN